VDKRTVALGVVAAAAVTAAVAVTVTHRDSSPKRDSVARYIVSVDRIEQQMRVRLTDTFRAYRNFSSTGKVSPKNRRELVTAERTLSKLEQRIAAIPIPPVAARLHRRLVALVAAEVGVAREVGQLALFSPKYGVVLDDSRKAGAELSKALAAVTPPKAHTIRGTKQQVAAAQAAFVQASSLAAGAQAAAVSTYVSRIAALERRLRGLEPPAVMRPAYLAQLRTMKASQTAGDSLAAELRKTDRSGVAVLGRRFTIAARTASTVGAQKAQIAAVKAYNRRVRAIGALQARVQQELLRLQRLRG
jgi:hypothetical protein